MKKRLQFSLLHRINFVEITFKRVKTRYSVISVLLFFLAMCPGVMFSADNALGTNYYWITANSSTVQWDGPNAWTDSNTGSGGVTSTWPTSGSTYPVANFVSSSSITLSIPTVSSLRVGGIIANVNTSLTGTQTGKLIINNGTSTSGTPTPNSISQAATINVASGKFLDLGALLFTSAVGTTGSGIDKTGDGELLLTGGSSATATYTFGCKLSAGILTMRSSWALGGSNTSSVSPLYLNGGTLIMGADNLTPSSLSSISLGGDFTLGGSSTVISNTSGNSITFPNVTTTLTGNRIITIGGSGTYTFGGQITGAYSLTVAGTGGGKIVLTNTSNNYSGGTTITGSKLELGATGVLADAGAITLGGGTLSTGASIGYSETVGTLALTDNSTIALGTGDHTLTFADSHLIGWTTGKTLTINGWSGTVGTGGGGTAGKIIVGSSSGLTETQLSQIAWGGGYTGAVITASGELVPVSRVLATEPSTQTSNASISNVTSNGFDINWTAGNGANSIVLIKQGSVVDSNPVDGNTYTANSAYSNGSQIGTGNYVVYSGTGTSVTVNGLSKNRTYYVAIYSYNALSSGTENYLTTGMATSSQYINPGSVSSTGSNSSGTAWTSASAWSGGVVPTADDNVTIVAGDKILLTSSVSCNNLTIESTAKLYNNTGLPIAVGSVNYVTLYGTTLSCNGTLGDKTDSNVDCAIGINFANNLTISGSGTISVARLRPNANAQNVTVTIDANMTTTYAGTDGSGGNSITFDNSVNDNIGLVVNNGKTLTTLSNSHFSAGSGVGTNSTTSNTITVNGTLNVGGGLSIRIASGKTSALAVNGVLSVKTLYASSATGGATPTITNNGTITITGSGASADFSGLTFVSGSGTFNLASGASISIGATDGLNSSTGPIRCTTRNFNSAANYTYAGSAAQVTGTDLPTQVNNLIINNTAGVTLSGSCAVGGNLTLTSGTLNTSLYNLTLLGNTSSGNIDASGGSVYFAGSSEQTFAAATTSGSSLSINPTSKVTNTGTLTGSTLYILSDVNGTGTFINNGTLTSTSVSAQQYIPSARNWYISSPITSVAAPTSNITSYFEYVEAGNNTDLTVSGSTAYWKGYAPAGLTMTAGKGYVAVASAASTLTFNGTLNNANLNIPVSRTADGFNLVGNPYPSYINWDNATLTNVKTSIWQRSHNGTAYVFDTYNSTGQVAVNASGKGTNGNIAPMQAFWVQVADGQTSGTINFNNTMRAHKGSKAITDGTVNDPVFKARATVDAEPAMLRLQVSNGVNTDETVLYQNNNAQNSVDQYDSPKMSNNIASVPEIYSLVSGQKLTINGVNTITTDTELALGFVTGQANSFSLKASQLSNFDSGLQIVLKDKVTGAQQVMTEGSVYNFTSDATAASDRFSILFRSSSATTGVKEISAPNKFGVYASESGSIVVDLFDENATGSVSVYNIAGSKVGSQLLKASKSVLNIKAASGIYMVKVSNGVLTETHRVIIK